MTTPQSFGTAFYPHGLRRVVGRDPEDPHREASALELFYDLTFVTSIGVVSAQLAQGVIHGHGASATGSFAIAFIAIVWAWVWHSWYSTSYSVDDWFERTLVLVQMIGVLVIAVGVPDFFAAMREGHGLTAGTMVAGYVVIRLATVLLWTRLWFGDPQQRRFAMANILVVAIAQVGWVVVVVTNPSGAVGALLWAGVAALDLGGPLLAQRFTIHGFAGSVSWNARHIAERYSLFALIAIGETLFGTLGSATEIQEAEGWRLDSVLTVTLGALVSFGMWWTYFLVPSAPIIARFRVRSMLWAYSHLPLFAAIAATGAGLHLLGTALLEPEEVSARTAVAAIAGPVAVFATMVVFMRWWLTRGRPLVFEWFSIVLPLLAIGAAWLGLPLWWSLVIVLGSPIAIVVGYELGGWRPMADQLDDALEVEAQ